MWRKKLYTFIFAATAGLAGAGESARGDSITLKSASAGTAGLTYDAIHVQRIEAGELFYTINTGQERDRPLDSIGTLKLDDEKAFSAADVAYVGQHWDDAIKGYVDAMQHTSKGWLKQYIAPRLLDAGSQAHRFDAAVIGWIEIARRDVPGAMKARPALPADPASTTFQAGATELEQALADTQGEARQTILSFLLDVEVGRKDTVAAQRVASMLNGGKGTISPVDTQAQTMAAQTQIALAKNALDVGDADKAISIIDNNAAMFVAAPEQSQALFIKAQSLEAKVTKDRQGESGSALTTQNANANDDWKDVVLAYMRVYTHFRDLAGSDLAAQSLVQAANLEEQQLKELAVALTLYQKAASEYKDTPTGTRAGAEVSRLAKLTAGAR